ncbi:hypothetical protein AVEN_182403-1 [Araneus ventricosus]|uniref:Uncharacterized protein n=1 Tax=Araneus ventricosus TaxID=182803 RepID=A0A4Y2WHW0_ARAVE|nr:hypothetical protein AVEN_253691-1 [Araneus ventricosus]GBO36248.1 hypothetical protein AVEN_36541-1 [Araneus ventricosus]GBO36249.1 hypothetical protein AVEN_148876-1 [Araneus ventricosus]GBO36252.1 hypothetical protein AVEN_182403-1 [Araneus ventricosus]
MSGSVTCLQIRVFFDVTQKNWIYFSKTNLSCEYKEDTELKADYSRKEFSYRIPEQFAGIRKSVIRLTQMKLPSCQPELLARQSISLSKLKGERIAFSLRIFCALCSGIETKDSDLDSDHHAANVRRAYLIIIVNQLVAT